MMILAMVRCVMCHIEGDPSLLVQVRDKTSFWLCRDCYHDSIEVS